MEHKKARRVLNYTVSYLSLAIEKAKLFKNVPSNKEYFIVTVVTWEIDYTVQGGDLMLSVKPKSGETLEVILN